MSWKNLAQNSLADSLLVSHECIKELDAIHDIIQWKHILNKIDHLQYLRQNRVKNHQLIIPKMGTSSKYSSILIA